MRNLLVAIKKIWSKYVQLAKVHLTYYLGPRFTFGSVIILLILCGLEKVQK